MKHAYLIIANRNEKQLQLLLDLIDDNRNDIFLMIDKKSNLNSERFNTKYSNLYFPNPINIYWGSYTQIDAEMRLFESAYNNGKYSYYHLISGLDLPLYSQDYIHAFFDKNPNKEFFTFSDMSTQQQLSLRTNKYSFDHYFRTNNIFYKLIHKLQFKFYRLFMNKNNRHYYFGSNWCSVDNEFVSYLLDNKHKIYNEYSKGFLVDEVYKHTLLMSNSHFKNKLYDSNPVHDQPNEFQGNLRYINWWDGNPKVWTIDDYDELLKARNKGHLFSRKFDDKVDDKIIYKIQKLIKK